MTNNISDLDRLIRAVVGAALIGATLYGAIGMWGWIGLLPLATAAIGWCPAYSVLGCKSCKTV